MGASEANGSPDHTSPSTGHDSDEVTVRQLEERSNRSSWRFMYVFVAVVLALMAFGIWMAVTQQSN